MSLVGLVRHMADVEQGWFREVMAGQQVTAHFESEANRDGAWDDAVATPGCVDEAWRLWREEIAFAEQFVDEAAGHRPGQCQGRRIAGADVAAVGPRSHD